MQATSGSARKAWRGPAADDLGKALPAIQPLRQQLASRSRGCPPSLVGRSSTGDGPEAARSPRPGARPAVGRRRATSPTWTTGPSSRRVSAPSLRIRGLPEQSSVGDPGPEGWLADPAGENTTAGPRGGGPKPLPSGPQTTGDSRRRHRHRGSARPPPPSTTSRPRDGRQHADDVITIKARKARSSSRVGPGRGRIIQETARGDGSRPAIRG